MKKKKLIILPVVSLVFALSFGSNSYADEWQTKACRLTVVDEDNATMECVSMGTVCSTIFDCFGIFKPGLG
ncbi:MAG: hypothetical protein P8O16_14110 [Algoriphagus sp.]|uniref:hypothetical protein n=1 Tax=Algoriphagus sp. TaxID=1872435 RepID=UPI00262C4CF8|nr:hypothetical protein [Algoriphagus sp.]MDG1278413.1 hypothetical protein [Algoriphagus sp.]